MPVFMAINFSGPSSPFGVSSEAKLTSLFMATLNTYLKIFRG